MEELYQNYVNNTVVNDEHNVDKEWLFEIDLEAQLITPFKAYIYRHFTIEEFETKINTDPIFAKKWGKV